MKRYFIRLDDACPTMDSSRWMRMTDLLDNYGVAPMVGVIPQNADPTLCIDSADEDFWQKVRNWSDKGWKIAMHGYDHCYISHESGINPVWNRSEFAGVPLEVQKQKIRDGVSIMRQNGIEPEFFFAPSHTFDENTLLALKECSGIRVISDTVATRPYRVDDFIFIPQFGGHCVDMPLSGVYTFCFHPNSMSDKDFADLEAFLNKHRQLFCSFNDLDLSSVGRKSLMDRCISFLYFTRRKFKGVI